jgi:predicted peptidase
MVLFMHGAGERGADNRKQLSYLASAHPFWETNPCIVIAPQCPAKEDAENPEECVWVQTPWSGTSHQMKENPPWPMRLVIALLEETIAKNPVDKNRLYVTGLSMGGYATWDLVDIPLWVFHGDADEIVPVSRSRDMVQAIKKAGGNPTYTEYSQVMHDSWTRTYSNPQVWEWVFAKKKAQ